MALYILEAFHTLTGEEEIVFEELTDELKVRSRHNKRSYGERSIERTEA